MTSSLTLWLGRAVSRLAVLLIGSANLIVLARVLEPEGRGRYFLFLSVVMVLTVVADLGLSQSATVYSSEGGVTSESVHRILLRYVGAFSIGTIVLTAAVLVGLGDILLPHFPRRWLWLAFALLPPSLYANVWSGMMVGMRRMRELNAVQLIGGAASLVLNLLLVVALGGGVEAALGVQAAVAFAQASAMFAIAQRSVSGSSNAVVSVRLSREMLSFGLRGYLGSLSTLIWTRSTIFLLNGYHGPAAVGIFSVSQQLAEKMLLPGQALHDVVFHKVSTVSRPSATAIVNRYIRMMLWGMLPVAGLGALVAPSLIALLFGHAYLGAANVFRVLLLGSLAMNPCLLLVPYFLGQLRRPGLLSILAWINVLMNLALAVLLVPPLAEIGAAVALVLTEVVGTAIVVALYLRAAQTPLARATWLQREDVALVVHQARAFLSER